MTESDTFGMKMTRAMLTALPLVGGQYRMINCGLLRQRFAGAGVRERKLGGGARILCDLNDNDGRAVFFAGTNDPKLRFVVRRIIRPGDTVIDIGANHGEHSLRCAQLVGPAGVVHAIEPNADLAPRIRESVARNGFENVHVHDLALSDRDGEATLISHTGWSGGGRLSEDGSGQRVRVRRGDLFFDELQLGSVRLVKIDAEGHEAAVLRGARRFLRAVQPDIIIFESNPTPVPFWEREAVQLVADLGPYELVEVRRTLFRVALRRLSKTTAPSISGRDILAIRRDCLPEVGRLLGHPEWV